MRTTALTCIAAVAVAAAAAVDPCIHIGSEIVPVSDMQACLREADASLDGVFAGAFARLDDEGILRPLPAPPAIQQPLPTETVVSLSAPLHAHGAANVLAMPPSVHVVYADATTVDLPVYAFFANAQTGTPMALSSRDAVWRRGLPADLAAIAPPGGIDALPAAIVQAASQKPRPAPVHSFETAAAVRFGPAADTTRPAREPVHSQLVDNVDGTPLVTYRRDRLTLHAAPPHAADALANFGHAAVLHACRRSQPLLVDVDGPLDAAAGQWVRRMMGSMQHTVNRGMCHRDFALRASARTGAADGPSSNTQGHPAIYETMMPLVRAGKTVRLLADGTVACDDGAVNVRARQIADEPSLCGALGADDCVCDYAIKPVALCTRRLGDGWCATEFGYVAQLERSLDLPAGTAQNRVLPATAVDAERSDAPLSTFHDTAGAVSDEHWRVVWDCCDEALDDADCTTGVTHVEWHVADLYGSHRAQANGADVGQCP